MGTGIAGYASPRPNPVPHFFFPTDPIVNLSANATHTYAKPGSYAYSYSISDTDSAARRSTEPMTAAASLGDFTRKG
jgi:hypothetical protein